MKLHKRVTRTVSAAFALLFLLMTVFSYGAINAEENSITLPEGTQNLTTKQLYNGVDLISFEFTEDSKLGLNKVLAVEFDPSQSDLYIDVTNMAEYTNQLKTVRQTVEDFNANNNTGKTAIAAVNGDMWMVGYAHARVEGSGTEYGGYSDAVVTSSLTIPRGFNMYNGEIISSSHISQETPFEGAFQSFGFTADNKPYLGQPTVNVKVTNLTKNPDDSEKIDGINRLPADKALVMYTDKGVLSHYALADAYEVIIDCPEDYVVRHGATIKGTVTAICKEGDEDLPMQENRIILTARGDKPISRVSNMEIGDEVEITVSVRDSFGNHEVWQNDIVNAVGGHMSFVQNGKANNLGDTTRYPSTIIGETNSGKVVFIQNDGRQEGYSLGIKFTDYSTLVEIFDLKNAFIVDGGGSSQLVALADDGYALINRPSDKDSNGEYGAERTVVNSVILSHGVDRNNPDATPDDNNSVIVPDNIDDGFTQGGDTSDSTGGSNTLLIVLVVAGSVVCFIIAVLLAIKAGNKKYGK